MKNINRIIKVVSLSMITSSLALFSANYDFNNDGRADILNRTGSSNDLFLMNSDGSYSTQNIKDLNTKYKIVGIGDYNGDGVSDIFWRWGYKNYIWYMKADGTHHYKNIGSLRTSYTVVGTGDFNGDGISDIFWRSGYKNYVWYMDDNGKHTYKNIGSLRTAYKVAGIGDFNGDGISDIFWRSGYKNYIWYMNKSGKHTYKNIGNVQTAYSVVGTGDFNGDGISDILWRKGTSNYLWYMKENGKHSYKKLESSSNTVDEIADYNGDGVADILWKSKEGKLLWLMQENGLFSSITIGEKTAINESVDNTLSIAKAKKEPYFKYAWHIDSHNSALNSEGYIINESADINVTQAWKLSMGKGVTVAVIDDGAEVEHEDLKENIVLAYNADDESSKINPYSDEGSHGNTCAGFIVAPINGKGIVGIAPQAKVIAIAQNDNSDEHTIRAFEYAKKHGAKVISCSWGTNNVSDALVSELQKIHDAGITVLFASGNEGDSLDIEKTNDESEVEWVIGVGASGENNDVTSYSNYGKNLEVIAPGGDTQESTGVIGLDDMNEKGKSNGLNLVNENYSFTDGTSFATPITAGVVALMYGVNPNITPKEVKEILIKTADKVGKDVNADYSNKNFDLKRAYGKVNAGRAVAEAKKLF